MKNIKEEFKKLNFVELRPWFMETMGEDGMLIYSTYGIQATSPYGYRFVLKDFNVSELGIGEEEGYPFRIQGKEEEAQAMVDRINNHLDNGKLNFDKWELLREFAYGSEAYQADYSNQEGMLMGL